MSQPKPAPTDVAEIIAHEIWSNAEMTDHATFEEDAAHIIEAHLRAAEQAAAARALEEAANHFLATDGVGHVTEWLRARAAQIENEEDGDG